MGITSIRLTKEVDQPLTSLAKKLDRRKLIRDMHYLETKNQVFRADCV
ncbi:hypothetical protein C8D91_1444 [Marinicella litoralis]|uniref:Uncharacterized protein n=1 Tax=Marinicella litoralis TaxID=644220 RepID=A0A4V3DI26_9GAMM|nr:hypothetical protein C8D91_1444 [Marinicella litoralis]